MKFLFLILFTFSLNAELPNYGNPYIFIRHCIKCHTVCSLKLTAKHRPSNDLSYVGKRYHEQQLRQKLTNSSHVRFKGTKRELDVLINWLQERK